MSEKLSLHDVYRLSERLMGQICDEMDALNECRYGDIKTPKSSRDALVNQYFAMLDRVIATKTLQSLPEEEKESFKAKQIEILEKMEDHQHLVTGHMRAQECIIEIYANQSKKHMTLGYTAAGKERHFSDGYTYSPTVVSINNYF